jgi:hypothetical protein
LETVTRVEAVGSQIRDHYKAQLETDPTRVPGWRLQSSIRRWIPNPQQALERLIEQFSVSEFLDNCSVKLADLEAAWARKNSVRHASASPIQPIHERRSRRETHRSEPQADSQRTPSCLIPIGIKYEKEERYWRP